MKFRLHRRISTGHIIGKCYKGAGGYNNCVWKILKEEKFDLPFHNIIRVKHMSPPDPLWSPRESITVYPEHLSKEEVLEV
jgi:hypothetical protein